MKKRMGSLCAVCVFLVLCMGCRQPASYEQPKKAAEKNEISRVEEFELPKAAPAPKKGSRQYQAKAFVPEASGGATYEKGGIVLDVSNASEGYVMLNYSGSNPKVKLQIKTPGQVAYTYSISEYGSYQAYPLSGGSGTYTLTVYESADAAKNLYAMAMTQDVSVKILDELKPFLYPNCYVKFNRTSACVKKGEELAKGCDTDLDVVDSVYRFVIGSIVYDYDKAETVQTGYTPYPDDTLASKKGICFDYASLMSAMLRSQQIPTRLEVGYVGNLYHAWISCYLDEKGWVDNIIAFNGKTWTMMDPTMAAGNGSKEVLRLEKESGYVIKYMF